MPKTAATAGTDWFLPGRKRRFATTPRATSDLIVLVSESGCTVAEAIDQIHYDDEAKDILRAFVDAGYGDTPLNQLVAWAGHAPELACRA